MLFLLHQFVELELKEVIYQTCFIGAQLKVTMEELSKNHDLTKLMAIAESNLKGLEPHLNDLSLSEKPFLSDVQRGLIKDIQRFGGGGEGLCYPFLSEHHCAGPSLPHGYVADIPAVMATMDSMRQEFVGVIGYLLVVDDDLFQADLYL